MARSVVIVVSDDSQVTQKARQFAYSQGLTLEIYSVSQWEEKSRKSSMQGQLSQLPTGFGQVNPNHKNNVLSFKSHQHTNSQPKKVQSLESLESVAIENAIHEFRGNLTEAAKALGIGRATLYRKVKQYNIDPNLARRRRAA